MINTQQFALSVVLMVGSTKPVKQSVLKTVICLVLSLLANVLLAKISHMVRSVTYLAQLHATHHSVSLRMDIVQVVPLDSLVNLANTAVHLTVQIMVVLSKVTLVEAVRIAIMAPSVTLYVQKISDCLAHSLRDTVMNVRKATKETNVMVRDFND